MTACPDKIVDYMNDYLDGDISEKNEAVLKEHLKSCENCQQYYHELNKTIAFVQSASHIQAPAGFAERTMARLPKEKPKAGMKRWLKRHPLLSAAAMFVVLMSTMLFSNFTDEQQFSFTKQPNIVVQGETVVVPAGQTVEGDLVVRNGDLRVEGEVDGNVTIINGSKYMASTGVITGSSEEIDRIFEWLWYSIKTTTKDAVSIVDGNSDNPEE